MSLRQVLAELNCRTSTQSALKLKPATMLRHQTVIPTLKRAEYFNYRTIVVHCEKKCRKVHKPELLEVFCPPSEQSTFFLLKRDNPNEMTYRV